MTVKPGTKPLTIHGISEDLRGAFKIECIKRGMTMQDAVTKLLEQFVGKKGTK
jgi:hypothetical protein